MTKIFHINLFKGKEICFVKAAVSVYSLNKMRFLHFINRNILIIYNHKIINFRMIVKIFLNLVTTRPALWNSKMLGLS